MRVAFVGNSYTYFNDLPTVLATLAALTPARIDLHHKQVTPGGSSLADHANLSKASGVATAAMLAEEQGWDYVVLQDQSQTPGGGKDGDSGEVAGVARAKTGRSVTLLLRASHRLRFRDARALQHMGEARRRPAQCRVLRVRDR